MLQFPPVADPCPDHHTRATGVIGLCVAENILRRTGGSASVVLLGKKEVGAATGAGWQTLQRSLQMHVSQSVSAQEKGLRRARVYMARTPCTGDAFAPGLAARFLEQGSMGGDARS